MDRMGPSSRDRARTRRPPSTWLRRWPVSPTPKGAAPSSWGISDRGKRIGTKLNHEWLRHRIYQLTGGMVTPAIVELGMDGVRLLVLSTAEAVEPVRYKGRIKWRVSDNCVEVDALTWHTRSMRRRGVDWSALPSRPWLGRCQPFRRRSRPPLPPGGASIERLTSPYRRSGRGRSRGLHAAPRPRGWREPAD